MDLHPSSLGLTGGSWERHVAKIAPVNQYNSDLGKDIEP